MERLFNADCDPKQYSPLALAFVGDAVFEVFVRERLLCQGNCPVNKLHKRSVEQVCCTAQAAAAKMLLPLLSEEELAVYNRGRNAHVGHVPKNARVADYHASTAFEALFGYLYLCGRIERLRELFAVYCTEEPQSIKESGEV